MLQIAINRASKTGTPPTCRQSSIMGDVRTIICWQLQKNNIKSQYFTLMTIIHANDPTTRFLSLLYNQREDIKARITEKSTNMDVILAIRGDDTIMMLGHGNEAGLCTILDENLDFERLIVNSGHVQFLRGKTCIGIWCKADKFAKDYKLHGLFSGMIISELYEASKEHVATTKEEIDREMVKFASRLRDCISQHALKDVPARMRELDDVGSELTQYNYNNLYYFE